MGEAVVNEEFADLLHGCAVSLRPVLEAVPTASRVMLDFGSGTTLAYVRGEGLVVVAAGHTMRVPESALDDERWMVAP